jgi:hypothetical protein
MSYFFPVNQKEKKINVEKELEKREILWSCLFRLSKLLRKSITIDYCVGSRGWYLRILLGSYRDMIQILASGYPNDYFERYQIYQPPSIPIYTMGIKYMEELKKTPESRTWESLTCCSCIFFVQVLVMLVELTAGWRSSKMCTSWLYWQHLPHFFCPFLSEFQSTLYTTFLL